MRFSVNNRRVDAIRNIQELEDVHLGMSHVDIVNSDVVVTCTMSFQGNLDFESLVDRISDVILSNPNFIRFRSKYNNRKKQISWIPIDGWTARQNSVCHNDNEDERSLKEAESRSIERVRTMKNGCAWVCHLKYQPVTNETIMRWILNHGLGDAYAIRQVLVSLLDDAAEQLPPQPKVPLRMKFQRAYSDRQVSKYLKPLKKKPVLSPETIPSKKVQRVDPIEFPALSLQRINDLAKENEVTVQDLLIHLVAETKQRIGETQDEWIFCLFNQRSQRQLGRMDNVSAPLPIYIGNGNLRTIHHSTKTIQGSSLVTFKEGYQSMNNGHQGTTLNASARSPQDRIVCVTNMLGVRGENQTVFNHKIRDMRFHIHRPNAFFFLSNGQSLCPTFTIEESKRADRGAVVCKTFMTIVEELNLVLADSEVRPRGSEQLGSC